MLDTKKLLTKMLTMLKSHDVDYIIEESISSTWKYRKWNSGILECWYEANPGAYTIGTQRGSMYAGAWITYTFPASFAYTPTVVASAMLTTDAYVVLAQTSPPQTTGVRVRLTASASVASTSNYTIHIYAIGRWK